MKSLMKVFVLSNDPSMMFVTHLEPVIFVLLNLHMSVTFVVSHLEDPVKQLIDRYLKYADKVTCLKIIRAFVLDEVPETIQNRVRLMHRDAMFSAGDEGGVKIIKKTDNQQSFYVTDDEKAIVVQDILKDTHPLKKGLDKKINIRLSTPVFIGTLQTLCFYKIIEICSENRVQKVAKGIS